ncbi:MAG TPA: carboxypeptidase-like regulatory domain-containing protein, partial [Sphingobacteriaceae bacterium]
MKQLSKLLSLTAALLFLAANVMGQVRLTGSKVSGQVIDETHAPLEFATIILMNANDSALVKSAMSDPNGRFYLENLNPGTYRVTANMMGYSKAVSGTFTLSEQQKTVDLGILALQLKSKALKEVTVTSIRPFVERKVDRLVVNVEGSSVAAGSTALEVLQKAPGVTVDQNDNISM